MNFEAQVTQVHYARQCEQAQWPEECEACFAIVMQGESAKLYEQARLHRTNGDHGASIRAAHHAALASKEARNAYERSAMYTPRRYLISR